MSQNSTEENTGYTEPTRIGEFLRHPEEVMGATSDPARRHKMGRRALETEVDSHSGVREDQVAVLEQGTAATGTREALDETNAALLDATADLMQHRANPGANSEHK